MARDGNTLTNWLIVVQQTWAVDTQGWNAILGSTEEACPVTRCAQQMVKHRLGIKEEL